MPWLNVVCAGRPLKMDGRRQERYNLERSVLSDPKERMMNHLQHYYYLYHATYGSPKQEATPVKVTEVSISEDRRKVRLTVSSLVPLRVYDLRPRGIRAIDGDPLITRLAAYTLNRLRQP